MHRRTRGYKHPRAMDVFYHSSKCRENGAYEGQRDNAMARSNGLFGLTNNYTCQYTIPS